MLATTRLGLPNRRDECSVPISCSKDDSLRKMVTSQLDDTLPFGFSQNDTEGVRGQPWRPLFERPLRCQNVTVSLISNYCCTRTRPRKANPVGRDSGCLVYLSPHVRAGSVAMRACLIANEMSRPPSMAPANRHARNLALSPS